MSLEKFLDLFAAAEKEIVNNEYFGPNVGQLQEAYDQLSDKNKLRINGVLVCCVDTIDCITLK